MASSSVKSLAVPVGIEPMEAKLVSELPEEPGWQFEPKWDGFRCLAFRDGNEIFLQSKAGQPLARYFPDVVAALGQLKAKKFMLDGELVIAIRSHCAVNGLKIRDAVEEMISTARS